MTKTGFKSKVVCAFLALLFMCSAVTMAPATAKAEELPEIMPCYTTIDTYSRSIVISGITAHCSAMLTAETSTSLKIVMQLQKKSGSTYSTVKTWTKTGTGTSLSNSQSKTINLLNDYRLRVAFTAGEETVVVFSYA